MNIPFDSTLESDIKELLKEVPPPIRAFFASGKVETIAKNLMQKNKLHIDQGAVVEREIILLLLGLKDPAEFTKALAEEAKLDQQTVNGIVQDINTQIFIPLREEEMKSVEMKTSPAIGIPQVRKPAAPSGTPSSHFHLQDKIAPPPRPAMPPPPRPPLKAAEGAAKPMDNRKLLEDHEEPHIEFKGAIYHPPIQKPPAVPPTPPKPKPVVPITPYSSDPYREPLE